jgi:hypothetical protein
MSMFGFPGRRAGGKDGNSAPINPSSPTGAEAREREGAGVRVGSGSLASSPGSRYSLSERLPSSASLQRVVGSASSLTGGSAASGADGPTPQVLGGGPTPVSLGDSTSVGGRAQGDTLGRARTNTHGRPSLTPGQFSQSSLGRDRSNSGSMSGVENLVREGFLFKKGVINLSFRKRYFLLTTRSLLYFEDKPTSPDAVPKGKIDLASVSKVDVRSDEARERFTVYTAARDYHLRAETVAESEAWIAAISGAVEMEHKHARPRRRSVSPLDVLKQEHGNFNPEARVHAPADLREWEKWSAFDVMAWLQKEGINGFKLYLAGVNGKALSKLQSTDLEKHGVTSKEDVLKILSRVSSLTKGELSAG